METRGDKSMKFIRNEGDNTAIFEREDGTRIKVSLLAIEIDKPEEINPPGIQVGDVVHYGDALPLKRKRVAVIDAVDAGSSNPYLIGGCWWKRAEHPTDFPGIYIRWKGGKNPVPGKVVTMWFANGGVRIGISDNWPWIYDDDNRFGNIVGYMVMPDSWDM